MTWNTARRRAQWDLDASSGVCGQRGCQKPAHGRSRCDGCRAKQAAKARLRRSGDGDTAPDAGEDLRAEIAVGRAKLGATVAALRTQVDARAEAMEREGE